MNIKHEDYKDVLFNNKQMHPYNENYPKQKSSTRKL